MFPFQGLIGGVFPFQGSIGGRFTIFLQWFLNFKCVCLFVPAGIKNFKELSLSLPSSGPGGKTMQCKPLTSHGGVACRRWSTVNLHSTFK